MDLVLLRQVFALGMRLAGATSSEIENEQSTLEGFLSNYNCQEYTIGVFKERFHKSLGVPPAVVDGSVKEIK